MPLIQEPRGTHSSGEASPAPDLPQIKKPTLSHRCSVCCKNRFSVLHHAAAALQLSLRAAAELAALRSDDGTPPTLPAARPAQSCPTRAARPLHLDQNARWSQKGKKPPPCPHDTSRPCRMPGYFTPITRHPGPTTSQEPLLIIVASSILEHPAFQLTAGGFWIFAAVKLLCAILTMRQPPGQASSFVVIGACSGTVRLEHTTGTAESISPRCR